MNLVAEFLLHCLQEIFLHTSLLDRLVHVKVILEQIYAGIFILYLYFMNSVTAYF